MTEIPKRLAPTNEVVRRLFLLSGNQCAFPECEHPIILGDGTYVGELCHIRAAELGGERFDATQSNEDRRAFENLMLMCHDHHVVTNDVVRFPVSRMVELKAQHEAKFERGLAGLAAAEGIQITGSTISLGGLGGAAPGAGGGGGGAIGSGARGGDGGPGGRVSNFADMDLDALVAATPDGRPPGAGGPGGAALGPNSKGGSGGGGGDFVRSRLDGEMLRRLGVVNINVRVGGGGAAGADGQPSGYDLLDDRGNVIVSVNARGGRSGDAASVHAANPGGVRESVSQTFVKAAFLSNSVEMRGGLFSVLSGGWDTYTCDELPQVMQWPLTVHLSLGGVRPGGSTKVRIVLVHPGGLETELDSAEAFRDNIAGNPSWVGTFILRPTISISGIWTISVRIPEGELAKIPLDVRQLAANTSGSTPKKTAATD